MEECPESELPAYLRRLKEEGYALVGLEQTVTSKTLGKVEFPEKMALVLGKEKATRQVEFLFGEPETRCRGYEIHMGRTAFEEQAQAVPLLRLSDGTEEGCMQDRKCMGTYLHGILDNPSFVDFLLGPYGLEPAGGEDYAAFKERQYDLLADHVRRHLDMEGFYRILSSDER